MNTVWRFLSSGAAKVLLPFAGALIAEAIKAALTWAKDLNGSARRIQVLKEATSRVEFWDLWLKTISTMGGDASEETRRAEGELRTAADLVNKVLRQSERAHERTAEEFQRYKSNLWGPWRFLMIYVEPSSRARGFRRFAYLMVPVLVCEGYIVGHLFWVHTAERDMMYWGAFHLSGLALGVLGAVITWYQARTFFLKREAEYLNSVGKLEL